MILWGVRVHRSDTLAAVKAHRLSFADEQLTTPNLGGRIKPTAIVIHYTGGSRYKNAVRWLMSPKSRVSAHVVISECGTIVQPAPFNRRTWHAGKSKLGGRTGVNGFSIGIELSNPGRVYETKEPGIWRGKNKRSDLYTREHVRVDQKGRYWAYYPKPQLAALWKVMGALTTAYGQLEVVGHSDVATPAGRKVDPGHAFPMDDAKLFGRVRLQTFARHFDFLRNWAEKYGRHSSEFLDQERPDDAR